ncbi:hypothetical protein D3C72_2163440 [compost metagenome]
MASALCSEGLTPVTNRINPTRAKGAYPMAWNLAARLPLSKESTTAQTKTASIGPNAAV